MNFDQLKEGDTVFYGFLGEDDGFLYHSEISKLRDFGYLQINLKSGGDYIIFANERKSTIAECNGNVISTNAKQAAKWVERKLKRRFNEAEKMLKHREYSLITFRKKYSKELENESV